MIIGEAHCVGRRKIVVHKQDDGTVMFEIVLNATQPLAHLVFESGEIEKLSKTLTDLTFQLREDEAVKYNLAEIRRKLKIENVE